MLKSWPWMECILGEQGTYLSLQDQQLDAIWSVQRFGFPFTSSTRMRKNPAIFARWTGSYAFLEMGFVQRNKKGLPATIDTFDLLFVICLCKDRWNLGHVGYIPDFRPNLAFAEQDLICPWEHCIEFMPFPPQSKEGILQHKVHLQKMFDMGAYADKSDKEIAMLRQMLEDPIPEDAVEGDVDPLDYGGCPIFGHCFRVAQSRQGFAQQTKIRPGGGLPG